MSGPCSGFHLAPHLTDYPGGNPNAIELVQMNDRKVVVVGAGPAGLAAAAELRRAGIESVVLEKEDTIASSWRRRYDRLRLNTSRLNSKLPGSRYPRGTPLFPSRDDIVKYLEAYAAKNKLDITFGTRVERIDRDNGGFVVRSSDGDVLASHVIVATGHDHTPIIPNWEGRDRFKGPLLHAGDYRNAEPFRDQDVLVVGPGCSGVEIAYDLATNGAAQVWLAVRTSPSVLLRSMFGGLPNDLPALVLLKLPTRVADSQMRLASRLTVGALDKYGLPEPEVGPMTRLRREGKAPAVVDKEMVDAIKDRRIEIVAGVESLDESGVELADSTRIEPAAIIAATGYRRGLEPLVGHLGVLDERGLPRVHRGKEAAPGLRFTGYDARPGQIRLMGTGAKRAARAIARDLGR
jgi:cation diffusion facilitator CzcD-associated flavoprotein CzcO